MTQRICPPGPLLGVNLKRSRVVGNHRRRAYNCWHAMHDRCSNPSNSAFHRYGGRGIRVCDRWNDFELFFEDMGNPPKGLSIDRIDNDGNYDLGNCRWVTAAVNMNNRCNSIRIIVDEKELTLTEAALLAGVSYCTIASRVRRGWAGRKLLKGPSSPNTSRNAGAANAQAKICSTDIERIRDMCRAGVLQKQIAELFGINKDYVGQIHRNIRRNAHAQA